MGRGLLRHGHQTQEEPAVRDQPRQALPFGETSSVHQSAGGDFQLHQPEIFVAVRGRRRNVIKGDLRLGIADGTENYVPLGQPDVLEHPQTGEVIYYDTATKDVFCRAWCWKNGNRSKLMPETTNAVINVDAMPPLPLATAEQAAEEVAGLLRRFTGAKTVIHKLTAETPRFTL